MINIFVNSLIEIVNKNCRKTVLKYSNDLVAYKK